MTELSSVIRNWAEAKVRSTVFAPVIACPSRGGTLVPIARTSIVGNGAHQNQLSIGQGFDSQPETGRAAGGVC
ncbi:MAG: hypothetical protein ACRDP2_15930, partial [Nocardioidaceae bacterium]